MRIFDNTQGVIDEKGRFQVRGLAGRVMFTVFPFAPMAGPLPWFVKSVTFNGENITDVPFDVAGVTDGSALQIVMTDKQTTLSGAVRNTSGQPVIDYTVVIFPSQLREGAMPGRYTRVVRPINKADSRREAFRRETIWLRRSSRSRWVATGIRRFANRSSRRRSGSVSLRGRRPRSI